MKDISYPKLIWFIIGFGLFYFTRTSSFIPIAIALAPIFILRLSKSQKPFKDILITVAGFILILEINFWTSIDFASPFPFILNFIRSLLLGIVLSLPYIATRFLQTQHKGFVSTLIFPVSAVAIYYIDSVFGPFKGVIIFYAYSQYGNLPIMQLLSLAGIWILIFLLSWFSSVVSWLWDHDFRLEKTKKGIVIFLSITISLLIYGGIKVSPYNFDYKGNTVRIAAAVFQNEPENQNPGIDKMLNERLFTPLEETLEKISHTTIEAASSHSEIIVFQEFSLVIPEEEEQEAILNLKEIAKENDVYLCIGYVSMPELLEGEHKEFMGYMELSDEEEEGRNVALFISNRGEIVSEYQKHNLVFGEATWVLEGPGVIPVVETPFGRIGIAICKDMEFPDYMRQAGKQNADIILAPSFEAISSLSITYAQMLRTIEQGFSFVRPCANGLSIAADFNGRILSSMNSFTSSNSIMYADVPTNGIRTIYTFIGDLFAWICVFVLFGFILNAILRAGK
jgi:apolipoprotein N-acyltransferase